ncbi:hypothetical protein ATO4_16660 [Aurantimonas sp. 22II-16-19i]|nr:hypothetical protein ATO4_16660 [Aurantimonas sp. 22II-16-19i]
MEAAAGAGMAAQAPAGSLAARAAADPESVDLFLLLRAIERGALEKPRIGRSRAAREDSVTLGQEPFAGFPAGNVARLEIRAGRPHVTTRFLGYFGPQGALPLATTLDALAWRDARDPSFLRFTEIVSNRFLQLFFRAFADARAITEADRPAEDRFAVHLARLAGGGGASCGKAASAAAGARIGLAGLLSARVKTPARLSQLLAATLGIEARIVERVPSWLRFEPTQQTMLGRARSRLGRDTALGARQLSLGDKVAIEIRAGSLAEYRALLPGGKKAGPLAELVFLAFGRHVETEIRLGIPADLAPPMRLGAAGELGLTGWIAPPGTQAGDGRAGRSVPYRFDARYVPGAPGATAASGEGPPRPAPPRDATPQEAQP